MTELSYKLTLLDFHHIPFNEQIMFIRNVLSDPADANKLRYRNSTGTLHIENDIVYSLWNDEKHQLDGYTTKYVHMSSSAYTKQAFFYFKVKGTVVKTNTRDMWGKRDPDSIINTVIEKALKLHPDIDECEVFITPFKKDYRHA